MKKILYAIMVVLICFSSGCSSSSSSGNSAAKTTKSYTTEKSGLSESERKAIAEREAVNWIMDELDSSKYDVNSSKYKVGTISKCNKGYTGIEDWLTVCGTLYLYNKYGSLEDVAEFEVDVKVSEDGWGTSIGSSSRIKY